MTKITNVKIRIFHELQEIGGNYGRKVLFFGFPPHEQSRPCCRSCLSLQPLPHILILMDQFHPHQHLGGSQMERAGSHLRPYVPVFLLSEMILSSYSSLLVPLHICDFWKLVCCRAQCIEILFFYIYHPCGFPLCWSLKPPFNGPRDLAEYHSKALPQALWPSVTQPWLTFRVLL